MGELIVRFILGGAIVSLFSILGGLLKPRTFAGLFGAAPSIALATLGLTFHKQGGTYASIEGRSMIVGAAALLGYSLSLWFFVGRLRARVLVTAAAALPVWFACAFGLWFAVLR